MLSVRVSSILASRLSIFESKWVRASLLLLSRLLSLVSSSPSFKQAKLVTNKADRGFKSITKRLRLSEKSVTRKVRKTKLESERRSKKSKERMQKQEGK
jgi:hypothetical protein